MKFFLYLTIVVQSARKNHLKAGRCCKFKNLDSDDIIINYCHMYDLFFLKLEENSAFIIINMYLYIESFISRCFYIKIFKFKCGKNYSFSFKLHIKIV